MAEYHSPFNDRVAGMRVLLWRGHGRGGQWLYSTHYFSDDEEPSLEYLGLLPIEEVETCWNISTYDWEEDANEDQEV